jgi:hypothetical protein
MYIGRVVFGFRNWALYLLVIDLFVFCACFCIPKVLHP